MRLDHISISVACSSYCLPSCKLNIIHLRKTNIIFHYDEIRPEKNDTQQLNRILLHAGN